MGRKSSIRKLSPELRKEIDRLLAEDRLTQAQIVDHMRKLGASVSESAVYRYNVGFQELKRELQQTREMAAVIGRELDATTENSTGRMVVESLNDLLFKAQMQLRAEGEIDDQRMARLATAAAKLASAQKAHADTEMKIRDRVLREASQNLDQAMTHRGLPAELRSYLRETLLGVTPEQVNEGRARIIGCSPEALAEGAESEAKQP